MIKNVQIILLNICFINIFGVKKTHLVSSKVKLYPQMTHIPTRYNIVLDPCNIRVEQQLGVLLLLLVLHKHLVRGAGVVVECQVGLQVSERHLRIIDEMIEQLVSNQVQIFYHLSVLIISQPLVLFS